MTIITLKFKQQQRRCCGKSFEKILTNKNICLNQPCLTIYDIILKDPLKLQKKIKVNHTTDQLPK
jgi:hypothetical protein